MGMAQKKKVVKKMLLNLNLLMPKKAEKEKMLVVKEKMVEKKAEKEKMVEKKAEKEKVVEKKPEKKPEKVMLLVKEKVLEKMLVVKEKVRMLKNPRRTNQQKLSRLLPPNQKPPKLLPQLLQKLMLRNEKY